MEKYRVEELKYFSDDEIISYLKKSWGYSPDESINVIGLLSGFDFGVDKHIYRLQNIELKNGNSIEYPIIDLDYSFSIFKRGVFVPPNFNRSMKDDVNYAGGLTVACTLILNDKKEREKRNNPCELKVDSESIVLFREMEDEYIIRSEDQRILIKDSIVQRHLRENRKLIEKEIKEINDERDSIINDTRIKKENGQKQIKICNYSVS
ncbi:MAG: hypothetical protein WBL07_09635 [Thiothrix litoralis]|uniref:hypothetical protein n=1 Tax=Thiothrix litoralis TaxID=2891210 RepID=UPI003C750F2D